MLKMSSTSIHVLSQPLSKTRDSFVLWKIFPCFLQCDFLFRNCIWLRMKLSKSLIHLSADRISEVGLYLESQVAIVSSESFADSSRAGVRQDEQVSKKVSK